MRRTSCSLALRFLYSAFSSGDILRVIAAWRARSLGSEAVLPEPLVGRSRICPTLDFTTNSLPRYLLIVLALAGDSTMTNDLPIVLQILRGEAISPPVGPGPPLTVADLPVER